MFNPVLSNQFDGKLFFLSNTSPASASNGPPKSKYQPHLNLILAVRYLATKCSGIKLNEV
jgi:hypothetical protein